MTNPNNSVISITNLDLKLPESLQPLYNSLLPYKIDGTAFCAMFLMDSPITTANQFNYFFPYLMISDKDIEVFQKLRIENQIPYINSKILKESTIAPVSQITFKGKTAFLSYFHTKFLEKFINYLENSSELLINTLSLEENRQIVEIVIDYIVSMASKPLVFSHSVINQKIEESIEITPTELWMEERYRKNYLVSSLAKTSTIVFDTGIRRIGPENRIEKSFQLTKKILKDDFNFELKDISQLKQLISLNCIELSKLFNVKGSIATVEWFTPLQKQDITIVTSKEILKNKRKIAEQSFSSRTSLIDELNGWYFNDKAIVNNEIPLEKWITLTYLLDIIRWREEEHWSTLTSSEF